VERLNEVGFDENRQADTIGGLSGGWKMKLELARAMLYNADLLLLDEVSLSCIAPDPFLIPPIIAYQSRKLMLASKTGCGGLFHPSTLSWIVHL